MFCRLRTFLLTLQPSAQLADSSRCSSPLLESHIMKPLGVANQAHICDILMLSLQCAPSAIVSAPTLMVLTGEGKYIICLQVHALHGVAFLEALSLLL